ncbi:MAG: T9SS type A sorting domain-containing protein, partial [Bacteroidia bacterium]|nr:T9SS type A sorting domain-containing protein [Bacteroidia bacterium]
TWVGGVIPTLNDSVTIISGDTVIVESSGKSCHDLTIESGGVLYANKSSTGSYPRYIYIYGNILCNGQIGNGSTYDLIGFNVEGDSCVITGTGMFDASRIRKYQNLSDTTTLVINRLVTLRIGGTAVYNNRSGTFLQVVVAEDDTLDVVGDGITAGNVAIDGINGAASSTGGGSITVNGTLLVSGVLYLTNSNSANPVSVTIEGDGVIETASISCPNSGASGHNFTIEDGGTLNLISADWGEIGFTNNTYSFLSGSTVIYSGDTVQTVGNPTSYHHLILQGSGTKTIDADMLFGGNLTIEEGAFLKVAAGKAVTVSGNCSFSGTACLELKSPVDSGAIASFLFNGLVNGTGTVQIERFIKKYQNPDDSRYHMLSGPVSNQEIQPGFVGDPPESGTDFYRWDEPAGAWINCKDESGNWNTSFQPGDNRSFIPGTGYLVAYPQDELKIFNGSLNIGDLSPDLTYIEGDYAGFNLIGNPYSSALNAEIDNWVKSNVDNAVWVWDGESGNYKSWNGSVGTLTDGIIPATQGFFVHAHGQAPTLTISASSRVHATQPFYKAAPENTLKVSLFHGSRSDGMVLSINDLVTAGFDPMHDVLKLYGAQDAPQLFWIEEDTYLSVNVRPAAVSGLVLLIGFMADANGEYRMLFEGQESFPAEEDLFLEDHQEQQLINLRTNPEYYFLASSGFDANRFTLQVGSPAGEEEEGPIQVISVSTEQNRIIIHGLETCIYAVPVQLFDLTGKLVLSTHVDSFHPVIETDLPAGIYIVKLTWNEHSVSRKIYLESTTS